MTTKSIGTMQIKTDPKTGKQTLARVHKFKSVSQRIASKSNPKTRYAKARP